MKFRSFGQTDRGLVREKNEDAFYLNDLHRVYAVADGLGGLPRGAEASAMAIDELASLLDHNHRAERHADIPALFRRINDTVYQAGRLAGGEIGMGTTLTVAFLLPDRLAVGHVGDTSLFRFRRDQWKKITADHTMEQEIRSRLKPGEEVFIPEYFSHTLTRCIGQGEEIETDVYQAILQPGDRYLLCSDGITKVLNPRELSQLIQQAESPKAFVQGLLSLANHRGGPDNSTAIALFFDE